MLIFLVTIAKFLAQGCEILNNNDVRISLYLHLLVITFMFWFRILEGGPIRLTMLKDSSRVKRVFSYQPIFNHIRAQTLFQVHCIVWGKS